MTDLFITQLTDLGAALSTDVLPVSRTAGVLGGSVTLGEIVTLSKTDWLSPMVSAEVSITEAIALDSTAFGKWHLISGVMANYNIQLPAVSGNGGKYIAFRVAPYNSATRIYTLTLYEGGHLVVTSLVWKNILILRCTGTAWVQSYAHLVNDWQDAGVIGITATTTNPTKGTVVRDKMWIRRHGCELWLRPEYTQTAGAGSAGSGVYLFAVPMCTIDSAQVNISSGIATTTNMVDSFLGAAFAREITTYYGPGNFLAHDEVHLKMALAVTNTSATDHDYVRSTTNRFGLQYDVAYGGEAHVPVTEFKAVA